MAGFSPWHFQSLFRALTRETVHGYVSARRMTLAADKLLKAGTPILEIALDLQFESQESFTRAFKRYHGLPPKKFRSEGGQSSQSIRKLKMTEEYVARLQEGRIMHPNFKEVDDLELVGLSAPFTGAMADGADNHEVIPGLWKDFHQRILEIQGRLDQRTYGVIRIDPKEKKASGKDRLHEHLIYYACVRTNRGGKTPKGMVTIRVAKATYACFTHTGPIREIDHTINYAFGSWLPQSSYSLEEGPSLEIFPANYSQTKYFETCTHDSAPRVGHSRNGRRCGGESVR